MDRFDLWRDILDRTKRREGKPCLKNGLPAFEQSLYEDLLQRAVDLPDGEHQLAEDHCTKEGCAWGYKAMCTVKTGLVIRTWVVVNGECKLKGLNRNTTRGSERI